MFEFIYKALETIMNLGLFSALGLGMVVTSWFSSINKSL
jgi:hypothetical protein